jgi:hypothetical protein
MVKVVATVFELPQLLGIPQYVEYGPSPRECTNGGCLYEGLLTAEGCKKGVCVKYRVKVLSRDRKNWGTEDRQVDIPDYGGCIPQTVADALWELAGRYDVGVWYDYQYRYPFGRISNCEPWVKVTCGITVNGVKLSMPYHCSSVIKCVERILEEYKREVEKLKEPPKVSLDNPAEELLRKYPELEAFGVEWVRAWAPHARERLIEIAKVLHRYPWMIEVIKKGLLDNLNPYTVEVYVAKDGSMTCLSLNQRTYCAQNGVVKAVKLELEFSRYEVYEGKRWAICRPKGLLTFTAMGKEYVKIL